MNRLPVKEIRLLFSRCLDTIRHFRRFVSGIHFTLKG